MLGILEWCRIHSVDPQTLPGGVPVAYGGDKLIRIGGDGTPGVAELCFGELAIARSAGMIATQNAAADGLDLAHRLPLLWAGVQELRCEMWVARRIARDARKLSREACELVDQAVADAIAQSPARLLEIAAAKIIEADTEAHEARIREAATKQGVWRSRPRPSDLVAGDATPGTGTFVARLPEAGLETLDTVVDEIADILADAIADAAGETDGPAKPPTRDDLRVQALLTLARPHDAAALLGEAAADPAAATETVAPAPSRRPTRNAVVYVHLHEHVLDGTAAGVARVEALGPHLLSQLRELLGDHEITLAPVIDLHHATAVTAYEHPTKVKLRTELRTSGDVFPCSSHLPGRRVDHDHAVPYDPLGPPGQTGDANDAPLTRRHHRVKTHQRYRLQQTGPGSYLWTTPHGLRRRVDHTGTHTTDLIDGEWYVVPFGVEFQLRPAA